MSAAHELFFLAHYSYNILNPLVEEAKAIEPTTQFYIDLAFGHEQAVFTKAHRVVAEIHWDRDGMLARSTPMKTKTEVDLFAEVLRAKIETLKVRVAA